MLVLATQNDRSGDAARAGSRHGPPEAALMALAARRQFARGPYQVEVRDAAPTTHPLTGEAVPVSATSVLWEEEVPLAVLSGRVLAASTAAPALLPRLRRAAAAANLTVVSAPEPALWRLLGRPVAGS